MIKFKPLYRASRVPAQFRAGDAGFDLHAFNDVRVSSTPTKVFTGIAVEIPAGYVGLICPRSGLAASHGITVTNAPGVIDSNYRGELAVLLHTVRPDYVVGLKAGDRIAQLLIVPLAAGMEAVTVAELSASNRGDQGFGSSGY